jgi:ABC-type cobalamin/Fe3+-siderophores transport system ATPase subunit
MMLDVRDLHSFYGASHGLRGVSIDCHQGELVVMLGRNGARKTTTMLSLMGTLRSRDGEIHVDSPPPRSSPGSISRPTSSSIARVSSTSLRSPSTSNTVCPAYVRTPLVENQIADQAPVHGLSASNVLGRVILTRPAIKRLIEPTEVAEAILYLCSDRASFINGSSLVLDRGWTAS